MNFTHVHLFLNHLPFLGMVFVFIVLIYSFKKNNLGLTKFLLWIIFILALLTIAVLITGDISEDEMKIVPGVSYENIETLETAAWVSLILIDVTGVLALIGIYLIARKETFAAWLKNLLISFSVIVIISFVVAAMLGGEIRHPEVIDLQMLYEGNPK